MSNVVISVEHLSKIYRLGQIGTGTLTNDLKVWWARTRGKPNPLFKIGEQDHGNPDSKEIWALRDVCFTVQQGEVLGIIGRNGAGKSTLLKILSRVTAPTSGKIKVKGRIASLLEVGTGFHPDLTGRENIYLNGAILGMRKDEIQRKFDEIVDFAEIEKFIDTPVKHYSSGMYVRLAFAVAAHLDPEILIVDEVLAVGDFTFQEKCLGKMKDVATGGRTVLFVSHNMVAISNLCTSTFILQNGQISTQGLTNNVIDEYLQYAKSKVFVQLRDRNDRKGNGCLRFTNFEILDEYGNQISAVSCGQNIAIGLKYEAIHAQLRNVTFSIGIYGIEGHFLLYCENDMTGSRFENAPQKGRVICELPCFPLAPGYYDVNIHCSVNGIDADWIPRAGQIVVAGGDFFGTGKLPPETHGGFLALQTWRLDE